MMMLLLFLFLATPSLLELCGFYFFLFPFFFFIKNFVEIGGNLSFLSVCVCVCLKSGRGGVFKNMGRRNFLLDLLIDRLRRLATFIITLQAESSIIHPRSYLTADYNGDNGSRMATTPDVPSSKRFHIFFFFFSLLFFPVSFVP